MLRVLLRGSWIAFAFACHAASLALSEAMGGGGDVIVDSGFAVLPDLSHWSPWLVDLIPYTLLVVVMGDALYHHGYDAGALILSLSTIMFWRALANASTILPASNPHCSVEGDVLYWVHGGCHDKIFSGHLAYATFLALVFNKKHPQRRVGKVALALVAMETVLLIATRAHYTVDCVVAIMVGVYQANLYHRAL